MMAADVHLASIGEWVATAPAALLTALGARCDRQGRPGPPGTATIGRALDAAGDDLDRALCAWVAAVRRAQHQTPSGDGLPYASGACGRQGGQQGRVQAGHGPDVAVGSCR